MMHAVRNLGVAVSLVLVSILAVGPQAKAQSTSSTAAYVYIQIQGAEGAVYGFSASSTGQLSPIPGAPWKPAGQIVGSTPTKFFTAGKDLIHSYGIGADGAIEPQLAQMPVFDYGGSVCGSPANGQDGAVLDHSGKYIFVLLENGNPQIANCSAYQTYTINSDGTFLFAGDNEIAQGGDLGLVSILGNENYAYVTNVPLGTGVSPLGFQREGSGALQLSSPFLWSTPTLNGGEYWVFAPDASPTGNYLVLQLYPFYVNHTDLPQLASYTVDAKGSISTTNTSRNMPTSALYIPGSSITPGSTFSPAGNLYVLYADNGVGNPASGIEIYNFNGAAPMTLHKTLLTGTPIDQVAWDSSNHLYAISKSANKLYVFTVTPTSVTEDTSISIGSPFKMVVVSSSGAGSSAATQFSAPLLTTTGTLAVGGQIVIDTSGNTTVEIKGQVANASYTAWFCPAVVTSEYKTPACFNIGTVSTNGSGNGTSTAKFPKSGDWAGEFSVSNSTGGSVIQTGLFPDVNNETYMSTLLPKSKTNGGVVVVKQGNQTLQDPLTSGSVSYLNGTVLFTLKGASPSKDYFNVETEGGGLDSSSSYGIGPDIITDAMGDGSSSANLATSGTDYGDMFEVEGQSGIGFIGGFSIP